MKQINNLMSDIGKKDQKIRELNEQLKNMESNPKGKKINLSDAININFVSSDQNIAHYSATCLSTDTFAEVEEKVYQEYPEFRETNNFCLINGRTVLRFKTIKENNIKTNSIIMIIRQED